MCHDRREVCFLTNVFLQRMNTPVARFQSEGVLTHQSVPPLIPAYNKFMGGINRTDQLKKTYGFDRKSKGYWLRLFFQFFDYVVNAYLLYKHGCITHVCAKDSLGFRLKRRLRPVYHVLFVQQQRRWKRNYIYCLLNLALYLQRRRIYMYVTEEAFGCVQYFADGVNEGSSITFCKKCPCSTSKSSATTRKRAHSFNELLLTVHFTLRNSL